MPMKNPPHPGDFIWTEIIESVGLTVLNGRAGISAVMRVRLAKAMPYFAETSSQG
jgi:plasmid maintenance system antidote protein VapI